MHEQFNQKNKQSKAKTLSFLALCIALSLILSFVDSQIPMPIPVPGVKLGLANVVVLVVLEYMGEKSAFALAIGKALLVGFLFGNLSMIVYSLCGSIGAFFAMVLAKKFKLSIIGMSVCGAVFHNMGQIAAAAIILRSNGLFYYASILIVVGVIVGILTGFCAALTLKHLNKNNKQS